MHISADILKGITYKAYLCKKLEEYSLKEIDKALAKDGAFFLKVDDKNTFAVSRWVSAKRTRSYPYARIYDCMNFSGKIVTIIPVLKDEGRGDRDYLQWDTISLMSLLNIHIIIAYYSSASINKRHPTKITDQRFDIPFIRNQIKKLKDYKSSPLMWNMAQADHIVEIGKKALYAYEQISKQLGIKTHSKELAEKRLYKIMADRETFIRFSRDLAAKAQKRESMTTQPKEQVSGSKATITICNHLGGEYFLTADETEIDNRTLFLIEAKNSKRSKLPSEADIKDGLLKMTLFTSLENVRIDNKEYNKMPVLKLTAKNFKISELTLKEKNFLENLEAESRQNRFKVIINTQYLDEMEFD
ncbi:MAG: hypothetical protein QME12_06685 [Nanoarchaeota archaeon]|nr:hypothetical protein [Nanoarchaeota archaeon]